jgi:hypothetical protein
MSQIFSIQDDKVVIKKLDVTGDSTVSGTLTVDNLIVKNQEATPTIAASNLFTAGSDAELNGQGIVWNNGLADFKLAYRDGGRLWTNGSFDINPNSSYKIDNTDVLSLNELGSSVTKSNLREIGTLRSLSVTGNTALAEFAFFNSTMNRLGLGTDEPNGALSVVDNSNEFVVYSNDSNIIKIGSYTNTDLEIVTDNLPRVTVKNNGKVIFGNEQTSNADVYIYGKLTVETVVSDNRVDRFSPLEFKASRERGIYGQGLTWTGQGSMRQFIMRSDTDRLWSSESIDLAEDQSYMINGQSILSFVGLGPSVTRSNLAKVGTLEDLTVAGEAMFMDRINASRAVINAKVILFNDGSDFTITNSTLDAQHKISIQVAGSDKFYADNNEIVIGNKQDRRTPVKVFGPLSIGINTQPEGVDLAVDGNIQFANKKFVTGTSIPATGSFTKGDICWNSNPTAENYVGWVCVEEGAPGVWLPFGSIARQ